ncbi:MAG: ChbG/HpnK family deacetylase [Verrucomicrobiota bacterium]|nr:ChbG/HpnK family deacetylase [Verrucomicrobiota bacterium]
MEPENPRHLIVNADDFGLTDGINRGIIEAHEHGIVSSASLMVRYPAAAAAADYARTHPAISVGLHFEAAEWRFRAVEWYPAYRVIDADDPQQVRAELQRQLAAFEQLMGRAPTHLDSHQHVHQSEPARSILIEAAAKLGIPLRSCNAAITYEGGFYGQTGEGEAFPSGISLGHLTQMLESLESCWTEFGCHPGYGDGLDSVYVVEREEELRVLCDPTLPETLRRNSVQLRSFHDLPAAPAS